MVEFCSSSERRGRREGNNLCQRIQHTKFFSAEKNREKLKCHQKKGQILAIFLIQRTSRERELNIVWLEAANQEKLELFPLSANRMILQFGKVIQESILFYFCNQFLSMYFTEQHTSTEQVTCRRES